ncbi:MAG: DMT family transporter [Anaerolineae bacterium]|nr:DMT family transporter [Anaerolineae bacterium]
METPSVVPSAAARLSANMPLVLAILLLVDSLHFVFARLLLPYLPPITSAFLVLAIATVETAVFLGWRRAIDLSVLWQHGRFFAVVGLLVATATTLSYSSVRFIDPAAASLLAQTSTLFALGLSILWLGERLTRPEVMGTGVAVLGVFIVTFQSGGGNNLLIGSAVVLLSAFIYALHTAVVKRWGQDIEFSNFFLFRVAGTTFFLLFFVLVQGEWQTPPPQAWVYLLLAGTFDVVISRVLYYLALRRLQMSYHAIILTLSPVVAVMWSFALFGTIPTVQGVVGGTAVIIGVIIVTLGRRRAVNRNP